ncbi:hypothetical protein F7734_23355 [Scytonema sp. UIC 10036]|uniref:hypothetical protein n=1 Tax=Scytonema sp. UIC 10036 TaxID=2304196 RepID=UPI0012DA3E40|nr:hypothetical protein [Scytonema sp. UIC 10036]MUG95138.1 hypothetical protein [Scytonema sp. UIC 10036]
MLAEEHNIDNASGSQVKVNGVAILTEDVESFDWDSSNTYGVNTYEGMTNATLWTITMYDGTVYKVDPKTLDDHSFQSLVAIPFSD